jgi:hypothetical protein
MAVVRRKLDGLFTNPNNGRCAVLAVLMLLMVLVLLVLI